MKHNEYIRSRNSSKNSAVRAGPLLSKSSNNDIGATKEATEQRVINDTHDDDLHNCGAVT